MLIARMWQLRHNVNSSDAAYVAVAEMYGCSLVTAEVRSRNVPGARCAVTVIKPA